MFRPGFELVSPYPFSTMTTMIPAALLIDYLYVTPTQQYVINKNKNQVYEFT